MEIKNLIKENVAFHCDTEEKANELLKKAHELGYKWCSELSYLDKNLWDNYKEDTCYDIYDGMFGSYEFFRKEGYKIIEYILDKDVKEKKMEREIIEGKDLVDMKFIKDEEGRLIEYKPLGKYIPKVGEEYWFIADGGICYCSVWSGCGFDNYRLKHYIFFKTEKESRDYKWYLKQLGKYTYEFSNDEWKNESVRKYTIRFNWDNNKVVIDYWLSYQYQMPFFKTRDITENFIKLVGEDRIKKYMFDIWD